MKLEGLPSWQAAPDGPVRVCPDQHENIEEWASEVDHGAQSRHNLSMSSARSRYIFARGARHTRTWQRHVVDAQRSRRATRERKRHALIKVEPCLLYTSPSPRDS